MEWKHGTRKPGLGLSADLISLRAELEMVGDVPFLCFTVNSGYDPTVTVGAHAPVFLQGRKILLHSLPECSAARNAAMK